MLIFKNDRNNKGFTLIELLIVIGIIAILAVAATTAYVGSTLKAARSEAYTNLESLRLLEEQFFAENGVYTAGLAALPGFQPGAGTQFTYALILNDALVPPVAVPYNGATAGGQIPCFIATATGNAGTRPGAQGDIFAIDCNNNKNF